MAKNSFGKYLLLFSCGRIQSRQNLSSKIFSSFHEDHRVTNHPNAVAVKRSPRQLVFLLYAKVVSTSAQVAPCRSKKTSCSPSSSRARTCVLSILFTWMYFLRKYCQTRTSFRPFLSDFLAGFFLSCWDILTATPQGSTRSQSLQRLSSLPLSSFWGHTFITRRPRTSKMKLERPQSDSKMSSVHPREEVRTLENLPFLRGRKYTRQEMNNMIYVLFSSLAERVG